MSVLLDEFIETGDYLLRDDAVEIVHQPVDLPFLDPLRPVVCEPPWFCERYVDAELWIELFVRCDGQPDLRAVIGQAHTERDLRRLIVRSIAPYVIGPRARRDYEQRSMFRYVPQNLKRPESVVKVSGSSLPSVVWLHPMDEFDRLIRNASQGDALALSETVRSLWPTEAQREAGVTARSIDAHGSDQVVQRGSQVLDVVGEDQADVIRGRIRLRGHDVIVAAIPRPTIFVDEVRLTVPELGDGLDQKTVMMVRPLDLRPYDVGPRLGLRPEERVGTANHA